ncbi:hypothetical protein M758_3G125300 [Ceratodon purpureus]|nr:hypothetical protein M758_3G125300 [Ceratodon purpureus]
MQLLSSYLCAATPLHRLPVGSVASSSITQCKTIGFTQACSVELFATRWGREFAGRTSRLHAQSQEGVDSETVNVTDLRNVAPSSSSEIPEPEPESANPEYFGGGMSEEEIREALLFEQGGDDEGPRLEEAARVREGEGDVNASKGFERTIPIPTTRGNGRNIVNILTVFGGLLDRPFGNGASVAAAGSAVIERVQEEIETLKDEDRVNEQLLFEVIRITRLLEMDMKLLSAAQKESTLLERLDSARQHCKEAILLANAL